MKRTIIAIVIIAGLLALYMTVSKTSQDESSSVPAASQTNQPAVESATVAVAIKNFGFDPKVVNVKKGTKVVWTNSDSASHTVTADVGSSINSGPIGLGQSFIITLNEAGVIKYHCNFHPGMVGTVVVTD
jgi:plastocyanin